MPADNPDDIHRRFAEGANAGDLGGLAALYESDAIIIERDGAITSGATSIRSHLSDLVAMKPRMEILDSYTFRHGDIVLLCSRWKATVTRPGAGEITMEFRGSEVARRNHDGTWLLIIDNPWGIDLGLSEAASA